MPKPRPWPNAAKDARDRSAEDAVSIINQLTPISTGAETSSASILIRVFRAIHYAFRIAFRMRDQGADIDIPEDR